MAEKDKKESLELQDDLQPHDAASGGTAKTANKTVDKHPGKKSGGKPNIVARMSKWFRELKSEAKKVVWPTFPQVVKNTIIVLITIAIVGTFIWVFDFIISQGNQALFNLDLFQ